MFNKKNKRIDENNNNTRSVVILVIVFFTIIIGLLVTIILLLNDDNKLENNNNNNTNSGVVSQVEDNKIVVTDDIKLDLSNKIDSLLSSIKSTVYKDKQRYSGYLFNYATLYRELTDKEKLLLVLEDLRYSFLPIGFGELDLVPRVKNAIASDTTHMGNEHYVKSLYGVLSYKDVNSLHNKFFGSDINIEVEDIGRCPGFYYSSATKEFYKMRYECGGASTNSIISYIEKFETGEDTINVYVDFGFIELSNNPNKILIYGDFKVPETSTDLTSKGDFTNLIEEIDSNSLYEINDNNKDKFSQYKFTFKKKDNNFYFEKVSKIR